MSAQATITQPQVKVHLRRLVELEYLLVHRGGRGQSFVYELLYEGQGKDGERFLTGLFDATRLSHGYDGNRAGVNAGWAGSDGQRSGLGRPPVGPKAGGGRIAEITATRSGEEGCAAEPPEPAKTHNLGHEKNVPSYRHDGRTVSAGRHR